MFKEITINSKCVRCTRTHQRKINKKYSKKGENNVMEVMGNGGGKFKLLS